MKNRKRLTPLFILISAAALACAAPSAPFPAAAAAAARQTKPPARKASAQGRKSKPDANRTTKAADDKTASDEAAPAAAPPDEASQAALKTELDELARQELPAGERVARLEAFVAAHSDASPTKTRALELLTSARAAAGDEKLRTGDALSGIELFRRAVADAPLDTSDKTAAERSDRLFAGVVSQLPANLYVLGQQEAAFDLARRIEERVKESPGRLLALAGFYFGVEQPDEAARVSEAATRLAPDNPRAHQALGEAYRLSLRLEKATEEYRRALELDPTAAAVRRSLADLLRATGKPEEALALYREQLERDAKDANARTGVVLSLFDAGRREEAERELKAATSDEAAGNLPLLVGVAYWYAAHREGERALEYAEKAVALEPRFKWVWARLTFARALLAQKRPLEAERALRLARLIGRFPTLDYELASALAAAGLYQEAAEELARTFSLKDGEIEARLAGRIPAHAASFTELLAPERRASIFQFNGADTDENARMLKALLAFHLAVRTGGETLDAANEKEAVAAALEFAAGDDEMRAFRQLYVASRLLQRGTGWQAVVERTDAAMGGVEAALDSPVASVATLADELYELRARAIASGGTPNIPDVPRNVLSNILRGRIEDLAGWALYNQGQPQEAVVRLKRAASVLPEGTTWWRASQWHLGAAYDASGNQREALASYVRSYRWSPDPTRRIVIEALYLKINGSLDGLDRLLEVPPQASLTGAPPSPASALTQTSAAAATTRQSAPADVPATDNPSASSAPVPTETAVATPAATPTATPIAAPSVTPAPANTEEPAAAAASPTPEEKTGESNRTETAAVVPAAAVPKSVEQVASGAEADGVCTLTVSESSIALKNNGGSALVTIGLKGGGERGVSKISAATPNWADIIILAEPRTAADEAASAARYTISSISPKTGTYVVTFTSPCGKREVSVEVK